MKAKILILVLLGLLFLFSAKNVNAYYDGYYSGYSSPYFSGYLSFPSYYTFDGRWQNQGWFNGYMGMMNNDRLTTYSLQNNAMTYGFLSNQMPYYSGSYGPSNYWGY